VKPDNPRKNPVARKPNNAGSPNRYINNPLKKAAVSQIASIYIASKSINPIYYFNCLGNFEVIIDFGRV